MVKTTTPLPRGPAAAAPAPGTTAPGEFRIPRPDWTGTLLALAGLVITGLALTGSTSEKVARFAAIGVAISIAISLAADARKGLQNLVRADLMALFSFYFLTLFEFFFPQPAFNERIDVAGTTLAVNMTLWAFGALLVGRHLTKSSRQPLHDTLTRPISGGTLVFLFWACFIIGFSHMLVAVKFDFTALLEGFVAPRFAQPWGRGQFGDWKALLFELNMLLFLVPPLAGIIVARRREYNFFQLATVAAGILFLLFYGFTSGTRYIFHSYVITFVVGFAFGMDKRDRPLLFAIGGVSAAVVLASTVLMLRFREVGLKNYMEGKRWQVEDPQQSLSVDINLYSMACIARVFPKDHDYLGWEVPYLAIIRPIPRALWPGKPEGMSSSIEEAVGASEGWTVAATFAGEAFMSGGMLAVIACGLLFGFVTAWWNRLSSPENSQFGILIYASGFFAAVISMRSLFYASTALLPTLSAIVVGRFLIAKGSDFRQRLAQQRRPPPRPVRRPAPARP